MKKMLSIIFFTCIALINAQYKDQPLTPDIKSGIVNNASSSLFGFLSSENFRMNHTFDLSYQTFGSAGNLALTTYTNKMFYKINDQLNIQADLSVVNSPYNSFGKEFTNQINGFYLSRAQINYKPTEDMSIILQYRNIPAGYYRGGWDYYSPFYRSNFMD
jgi:hypothetical protein